MIIAVLILIHVCGMIISVLILIHIYVEMIRGKYEMTSSLGRAVCWTKEKE